MSKPKIIAFYLPQFHPTPDNDKWWGKGFTEWTNVGKAKPLFRGHYQPKVPADLGYYDLRLNEVREAQAQLAIEAGLYGFCYYHYWFGNGKEELEIPFNEVLKSGKPDFPFMLCWANDSWYKKQWNKDVLGSTKEILIEQTYPGEKDHIDHFYKLLPAFKDERYIKIQGKPTFMIYKPHYIPDVERFIELWNKLAKENGLKGISFIAHIQSELEQKMSESECISYYKNLGFDFINFNRLHKALEKRNNLEKLSSKIIRKITRRPLLYPYLKAQNYFVDNIDSEKFVIPTIIPNWDHTPRSGENGLVYTNSSPENFKRHLKNLISQVKNKEEEFNYVMLKSWNEWGEGNFIEPDLKYGKGFLNVIKEVLNNM